MEHLILKGDVISCLQSLPDNSIHCVVTSPPYWGMRDYGIPGQIGLELTPEEHVSRLVEVFREVKRVLRSDGVAWVIYGDCYCGSWGNMGHRPELDGTPSYQRDKKTDYYRRDGWDRRRDSPPPNQKIMGLKNKDLVGMSWRVAFGLQGSGWYLRSDVIWSKPNPMPESVVDRPHRSHEYIFLLSKSPKYFYDIKAFHDGPCRYRRTVWEIPIQARQTPHFASFPEALVEPCIMFGTSDAGCCPVCGSPWHRISTTVGWAPSCVCDAGDPIPCSVLDPFGGSGTTSKVARDLGRSSIMIELNPEYVQIAMDRLRIKEQLNTGNCKYILREISS